MNELITINTIQDIQHLVIAGFTQWEKYGRVVVRQSGDLLIFNYSHAAQYANEWTFFEQVSRGLIIHRVSGEIVARPFDKFFNWAERGHKAHGHLVTVTEKIDGSLGILYRNNGYKISTRGTFDSEQAIWATNFLPENYDLSGLDSELTLLFEIIYPDNRIIVDYGDNEDLVLLAARNRFTGDYLPFYGDDSVYTLGQRYGFTLPKVYQFNNVIDIMATCGALSESAEGYVAEFSSGERWKFKGDRYLELHKLVYGLSFKKAVQAVETNQVEAIKAQIPEEFLGDFDKWVNEVEVKVANIERAVEQTFSRIPQNSHRKDFALWVKANAPHLATYLFAMLDGKPIKPIIFQREF